MEDFLIAMAYHTCRCLLTALIVRAVFQWDAVLVALQQIAAAY